MFKSIVGALMLFVTLESVQVNAQSTQAEQAAPQLQVSWLSGKIEVETPNQTESVAGQKLPDIRSGSIVRVLSGSAAFDSNYHATVRARNGDAFHFAATQPENGRPGVLSIAAVEKTSQGIEVSVGDQKFRLRKKGTVSITASGQGEMTIENERGNVIMEPGSIAQDGTVRSKSHVMEPGEKIIVRVPEGMEFVTAPMNFSAANIVRENDSSFLAEANWPVEPSKMTREDETRNSISHWPESSRMTAEVMLEKYGPPNSVSADKLVWNNNGNWKRTTVYSNPSDPKNILEQTVSYDVPENKLTALAEIDISLKADRNAKELSASSNSEEMNYLALNLGNDVITGKKTPEEAQDFYIKSVSLSNEGKSFSYTQGLLFQTH